MKRILNFPIFYNLYQNLIGSSSFLSRYSNEFIKCVDCQKILDLGCATAPFVKFLPKNIIYTGIDKSKRYIKYSKNKYPQHNFICKNISNEIELNEIFDIVFSEALMSCLNDEELEKMLMFISKHTNKNSRIILSDMNYEESNTFLQKMLFKSERGHYLRGKDDYIKILSKHFNIDKTTVIDNVYIIPYVKIVFELSKIE